MSDTVTPVEPAFPLDDDSYGGFIGAEKVKMKAWVRAELALVAAGKTEDERKTENP